jgi:hypothetical protein
MKDDVSVIVWFLLDLLLFVYEIINKIVINFCCEIFEFNLGLKYFLKGLNF